MHVCAQFELPFASSRNYLNCTSCMSSTAVGVALPFKLSIRQAFPLLQISIDGFAITLRGNNLLDFILISFSFSLPLLLSLNFYLQLIGHRGTNKGTHSIETATLCLFRMVAPRKARRERLSLPPLLRSFLNPIPAPSLPLFFFPSRFF